ncbi:MAG: metal-dependent phosphohydrolase [Intrasporangium sp.]|uniref:HD-GYP domain-containing protein n=1 Tax=Intrasporangium sp. TaxID=1925024 RepID=UPI0026485C11|nr:HD domain-containing phosphohydrolase [Intrasporangium sp.]MDN5796111.1 metal-dependent phosphohydrolase [Intrasporangium sp.]
MSAQDIVVLVCFGVAIMAGEWYRLSAPGLRATTPIASAAGFGFAFTTEIPAGHVVGYSWAVILLVGGAAMAAGSLARWLAEGEIEALELLGRFAALVVATLLYRVVYLGEGPGRGTDVDPLSPPRRAALMLVIVAVALLVDLLVLSSRVAGRGPAAWRRRFLDDLSSSVALAVALAVTGVLIAVAVLPLGLTALPLFLSPLVLSLFAFRRYVAVRETYRQGIRTLSRLTEVTGYTPSGHAGRVADLAVAMGSVLAIPEREVFDLEYAALLHDIGQVALIEPIPGGATLHAAPADQRRIERDTVRIVRETGVMQEAAAILEHQTTPYRQMREFDEPIPLTSRVLKVANAFDDLTGGARSRTARDAAVERIFLGLGYEYDPKVVDALVQVVQTRARAA